MSTEAVGALATLAAAVLTGLVAVANARLMQRRENMGAERLKLALLDRWRTIPKWDDTAARALRLLSEKGKIGSPDVAVALRLTPSEAETALAALADQDLIRLWPGEPPLVEATVAGRYAANLAAAHGSLEPRNLLVVGGLADRRPESEIDSAIEKELELLRAHHFKLRGS
jgi:hypothetical protein